MADSFGKRSASAATLSGSSVNLPTQQHGVCYWCFRAAKWIPVLFIVAVISWSYYAYVIQLCFLSVQTAIEQVFFLFFYHIIFVMFIWSYWQTVFTPIGRVPSKFRVPRSEMERLARAESQETQRRILDVFAKDLPISNRTITGALRYCEKCFVIKPDRAHHCSMCGTCVLKMDHHCPWVNNCVNFTNYKFFVLFLGYALLYCIFVSSTSLRYFVLFWEGQLDGGVGRFHILFLFFVAVMFAISLVSLFGYHIYLSALNRTTLESFRTPIFRIGGPDKNGFNLGRYNNIQEIFGDDKRLWFLPIFSSFGDGVQYPVQLKHLPDQMINQIGSNYESMGTTTFPAINSTTDAAANNVHDNTQQQQIQSVHNHIDSIENGKMLRDDGRDAEMNLLRTNTQNGDVHMQQQSSLSAVVVVDHSNSSSSSKARNGNVAIDIASV